PTSTATDQIANLITTHHQAATATDHATATLDNLLTTHDLPGDPHTLARAISHTPANPKHRQHPLPPAQRPPTTASRPDVTGLEHLLHDLKVSDPDLLLRATALDHASRALAAEGHHQRPAPHHRRPRIRALRLQLLPPPRLTAQDTPATTSPLTR